MKTDLPATSTATALAGLATGALAFVRRSILPATRRQKEA
jgi:hypothetical protein